jgi:hypothetical protein
MRNIQENLETLKHSGESANSGESLNCRFQPLESMLIISGSLALPGNHFPEFTQQLTCLAFGNQPFLGHLEKYQNPSMQCRQKHCSNWLTPHSAPQSCYRV